MKPKPPLASENYDCSPSEFRGAVLASLPFKRGRGVTVEGLSRDFGCMPHRVTAALSSLKDAGHFVKILGGGERNVWVDDPVGKSIQEASAYWQYRFGGAWPSAEPAVPVG